ncbi:hypothetical protein M8J76_014362 [Diaphorina citri]|nr:hypothetical protein M8J75_003585 [Diaphorina citri]KAI5722826.1 hypothetical protein M8J76_014362 [Diaphorina citri]
MVQKWTFLLLVLVSVASAQDSANQNAVQPSGESTNPINGSTESTTPALDAEGSPPLSSYLTNPAPKDGSLSDGATNLTPNPPHVTSLGDQDKWSQSPSNQLAGASNPFGGPKLSYQQQGAAMPFQMQDGNGFYQNGLSPPRYASLGPHDQMPPPFSMGSQGHGMGMHGLGGGFAHAAGMSGVMPSMLYLASPGFIIPSSPVMMHPPIPQYGMHGQSPYGFQGSQYGYKGQPSQYSFQGQFQRPGLSGSEGFSGMGSGYGMQRPGDDSFFNAMQMTPGGQNTFQQTNRPRPYFNKASADSPSQAQQVFGTGSNRPQSSAGTNGSPASGNGQISVGNSPSGRPKGYYLYGNNGGPQVQGLQTEGQLGGMSGALGSSKENPAQLIKTVTPSLELSKKVPSSLASADTIGQPPSAGEIKVEADNRPSGVSEVTATTAVPRDSQTSEVSSSKVSGGATERDGIPDNLSVSTQPEPSKPPAPKEVGGTNLGLNIAEQPSNLLGGSAQTQGSMGQVGGMGGGQMSLSQSGSLGELTGQTGSKDSLSQAVGTGGGGSQINLITLPAKKTQSIKLQTVGAPAGSYSSGSNQIKLITMSGGQGQTSFSKGANGGKTSFSRVSTVKIPGGNTFSSNGRLSKYQIYPNSFLVTPIKTRLPRPGVNIMDENYSLEDMSQGNANRKGSVDVTPGGKSGGGDGNQARFP